MNEDEFPEDFFREIGHSGRIKPESKAETLWAEESEDKEYLHSTIRYPGNVHSASEFIHRLTIEAKGPRFLTGQSWVERGRHMQGEALYEATGYWHTWQLVLHPEEQGIGYIFMTPDLGETEIKIATNRQGHFYAVAIEKACAMRGASYTHKALDEKGQPLKNRGHVDAAATPQPHGINISNITSAGDININLSNVAGRDQNTTTNSTTITQQTSPAAASADLVSTTSTDDREIRQYDSFPFFASPDGFTQWWGGYVASIGENRIYPSLGRLDQNDEFHEYGNREWEYVYSGCVISFIIKAEEAEKLRITPIVKTSTVDADIRKAGLDKCEKHIAGVVQAAKSKFSGIERIAAATPQLPVINKIELSKLIRQHYDLGEFKSLCFELQVAYDDLPGETLTNRVEALVEYLERRGRVQELFNLIKQQRPNAI